MDTVSPPDKQDQRNNLESTFTMIMHVHDAIYNAKENVVMQERSFQHYL